MDAHYALPRKPEFNYSEPSKKTDIIAIVTDRYWRKILLPEGTKSIEVENGYDNDVEVTCYGEERDNPNYQTELWHFEQKKVNYQIELAKWEQKCKEIIAQNELSDRKRYEELKKKFEGNS